MDLGLAGRVALVCGSTKGLGRAVAKALAHEGARVAINGRHEDSVEHAAQQLSSESAQAVMPFVADVGDPAQAEALVERVRHQMGRLDVLFCNASGPPAAPFTHQPAEAFHRALELNLLSTVHLARAAVPIMRKLEWGRIICLASVAANNPCRDSSSPPPHAPAFWGSRRRWPTRSPPRGSPSTSCVPASSRRSGSRSSRRAARSASRERRRRSCATWSRAFRSAAWAAPTSSPRRVRFSRPSGPAILPAPCYRWTAGLRDPFSNASRTSHPASRVSMKAIVKEQRVPGLKVATVPKPSPGPGEVLIAVRHAGVCGTDVHIADWDAWAQGRIKPPLVVGHEFAGEIVAAGDGVSELRPGQLVTAEGHIVCGHCLQCRTGNSHICKNTRIIGVDRDGAFAEYIAMPATNVLPLDDVPTTVGAILEPMGNAFHAVLDRKSTRLNSS